MAWLNIWQSVSTSGLRCHAVFGSGPCSGFKVHESPDKSPMFCKGCAKKRCPHATRPDSTFIQRSGLTLFSNSSIYRFDQAVCLWLKLSPNAIAYFFSNDRTSFINTRSISCSYCKCLFLHTDTYCLLM